MRFGYWMPVFGGWLRNVPDEGMEASWDYAKRLTQASERWGYDLTLIAELNLNDIKGVEQPALDAWSTAAAPIFPPRTGRALSCGPRAPSPCPVSSVTSGTRAAGAVPRAPEGPPAADAGTPVICPPPLYIPGSPGAARPPDQTATCVD